MATGFNRLSASAYSNSPAIAIVQPAKDWRYYETSIIKLDESRGKMLKEYKESNVWREKYKTWTDACVPLDMSRSHANALIAEETSISRLSATEPTTQKKETLKTLAKLPGPPREEEPEKPHIRTADEVIASNGESERESTKPPMDGSGCVVPQSLLANDLRDRIKEVTEAAYWASKLKCLFEKLQTDSDPLFARAKDTGSVQTFMAGAARMHHALADCSPDIVCPECGGEKKTCHYCCGTGWISQSRWHQDWEKSNDRLKQAEVHRRATLKAKYD